MSGIGIITNPHSKLNKRNPERMTLLGYILGAQGQLEITNALSDLERVAREFKAQGISILAINGGDGTISRTLTAFIKEYGKSPLPRIALLRGGTINVVANNIGIRGTPEQILYRLVEAHARSVALPVIKISTIAVEGNYGFLFGTGVAANFLKEYYQRKTGPWGAFLWVLGVYFSGFWNGSLYRRVVRDTTVTLLPDAGSSIRHHTCAIFCSTVGKLPLGYPLFPLVGKNPGHFQCVSFTFTAPEAVWQLPGTLIKRQEGATKGKMSMTCRELSLVAEQAFDYTLDGELYVARGCEVPIHLGPEIEFVTI